MTLVQHIARLAVSREAAICRRDMLDAESRGYMRQAYEHARRAYSYRLRGMRAHAACADEQRTRLSAKGLQVAKRALWWRKVAA